MIERVRRCVCGILFHLLRLVGLLDDIGESILLSSDEEGIIDKEGEQFDLYLQEIDINSVPLEGLPIVASSSGTLPVTATITPAAFTQVAMPCDPSQVKVSVIKKGEIFESLGSSSVVSAVLSVDLGDCVVEGQQDVIHLTFSNVESVSVVHRALGNVCSLNEVGTLVRYDCYHYIYCSCKMRCSFLYTMGHPFLAAAALSRHVLCDLCTDCNTNQYSSCCCLPDLPRRLVSVRRTGAVSGTAT